MNYALQEPSPKPGRTKLRGKKKKPKKPSLTNCGFRRHSPKIPPIIEQTCAYLESKALQHEGLFRVSGSQESIRNYKDRFEKGKKVDLTKELNPNTVAGVLKLFFTELINPIMTYELYPALVSAMSVTETDLCVWCLRQVMDVMPPGNREVIRRITSMFRTISQFESDNKMSARNIALVMNPALFRDPVGSMRDFVKNGGIRVRLVETFITHHDDIFQLPRAALDERIRMISDGITEKTEILLLEFSQTLQQNAISLATALMNEGETELVVCFENINNLKQSIEAWREGHTGAVQEDFEEDTRVNAKVRRTTSEDPTYSSQLSSPTLQRIKVDRNHSDVNVLTASKSAQALLPEEYETFEIEETGEGEESTVLEIAKLEDNPIEAAEDAATSPTSLKKTDIKLLPPPVFLKSSESEVRLRRRRPTGKPKRKREFDASSDSVNGEAAAEVESVESTPNNASESRISPRSSVRLFFDGRDTKVLADESNIDIGKLFQYVVDGKPEKIREALDSTEPEARFLLIFRLQRAARDFIVALDECK